MKKCPLLKSKKIYPYIEGQNICAFETELFQDCIGEECTAWHEGDKFCTYFTMNRDVKID